MRRLERRELLAELIVHVAGDAPALVLLHEHEVGQELGARVLGLALLPLGQIEVRADDSDDRTAGLAPDRKPARQDVNVMTVLVPEAEFGLVGRLAARHALVRLVRDRPVVGMHQALPGADVRLDLVVVVAEHLLPARRVDDRHSSRGSSPRCPPARRQTPATGAPRSRAAPSRCALRSVMSRWVPTMRTIGPSLSPADRQTAREHGDVVTVLVAQAELAFVGRPARADRIVQRFGAGSDRRDAAAAPTH